MVLYFLRRLVQPRENPIHTQQSAAVKGGG
ncbi:uncharacterized protein METZ01_LOCUS340774, partial [marine metagenome]